MASLMNKLYNILGTEFSLFNNPCLLGAALSTHTRNLYSGAFVYVLTYKVVGFHKDLPHILSFR